MNGIINFAVWYVIVNVFVLGLERCLKNKSIDRAIPLLEIDRCRRICCASKWIRSKNFIIGSFCQWNIIEVFVFFSKTISEFLNLNFIPPHLMNFFNRLIKYYLFHSIEAKNSKENYEEDITSCLCTVTKQRPRSLLLNELLNVTNVTITKYRGSYSLKRNSYMYIIVHICTRAS